MKKWAAAALAPLLAPTFALSLGTVAAVAGPAQGSEQGAVSLRTVEGRVVEVRAEVGVGEGELEQLAVRLEMASDADSKSAELVVLLAPGEICREIDFEVKLGDLLRARIFVEDGATARAQKALNLTRGRMARFRTLRDIPLWSAGGAWHGGPSQMAPGTARSPRHHGGGPPGPGGHGGAGRR